jgi:hypothetical protein
VSSPAGPSTSAVSCRSEHQPLRDEKVPAVTDVSPGGDARAVTLLRLQGTAGNAAVASLLSGLHVEAQLAPHALLRSQTAVRLDCPRRHLEVGLAPPPTSAPESPIRLQRHSSFEHKLLGDVKPSTLQIITDVREFTGPPPKPYDERKLNVLPGDKVAAVKALDEQLKYLTEWQASPPGPGVQEFHGVPVVSVKCEGEKEQVTCTIGEMNTLADYFGNPDQIKHSRKQTLTGILQQVRQDTWGQLHKILEVLDPAVAAGSKQPVFAGSITSAEGLEKEAAIEAFTADGRNRASQTYLSNAGRNACHFAPQSWYRWKDFHEQARDKALQAYKAKQQAKVKENDSLLKVSQDLANEAMVTNGFGDHYLQDSFAGGHLINKTLIMQWFVEWLGTHRDDTLDKLKAHLPAPVGGLVPEQSIGDRWVKDWDKVKQMSTSLQPKLANIDLYGRPIGGVATDPQTVEEQATRADRIARAGVAGGTAAEKERSYEAYLAMLNNPLIQLATKVLHDKFCAEGLVVGANGAEVGRVFGDDHMLQGGAGVGFSAETAQMSQAAITDIVRDGKSATSSDAIMNRLPNQVRPPGGRVMISLEEWHTGGQLKALCDSEIFPSVLEKYPRELGLAPGGSAGKISQDVPGGTAPSTDIQSKVQWVEDEIEEFRKKLPDFGQIKRDVEHEIDDLRAKGTRAVKSVESTASKVWSGVKGTAEKALGAVENLASEAVGTAEGAVETVAEDTSAAENDAMRKIEDLRDELPRLQADIEGMIEDLRRRALDLPIAPAPDATDTTAPPADPMEAAGALQAGAGQGDASGGEF